LDGEKNHHYPILSNRKQGKKNFEKRKKEKTIHNGMKKKNLKTIAIEQEKGG